MVFRGRTQNTDLGDGGDEGVQVKECLRCLGNDTIDSWLRFYRTPLPRHTVRAARAF